MSNIKLGVTTHSYVEDWVDGRADLEDMFRHCAELGLDGLEIVQTSMFPDYPYLSDAYAGKLKRLEREYGVKIIALDGNMDRGKRYDRDLNSQEMLKILIRDLQNASQLEVPVVKSQYLMGPEVMQQAEKYARQYGVILTVEIHNPETPTSPIMTKYYNMMVETGSKYLGFVPDFGMLANRPNKAEFERAIAGGARREILDYAVSLRYDGVSREEGRALMAAKDANGFEMGMFESMYGYMQFSKVPDYEGLVKILPYCPLMHGKFIDILEDGTESTIPYADVLKVLNDAGYDRYITSEFEGSVKPNRSSFDYVREHIEMERKILAAL